MSGRSAVRRVADVSLREMSSRAGIGGEARLIERAIDSLAERPELSFAITDRLCRVAQVVDPLHLILRAEALVRLGHTDLARRDARAVLEIEPQNQVAGRLLMEQGTAEEASAAAAMMADTTSDSGLLSDALRHLAQAGEPGWARGRVENGHWRGWAAWRGDVEAALLVITEAGTSEIRLNPAGDHPLADRFGAAADFVLPLPDDRPANLLVRIGSAQHGLTRRGLVRLAAPAPAPTHRPVTEGPQPVTIVIPVYDDFIATRRCIESVLAHRPARGARIILVEDASPDPRISAYLDGLSAPDLVVWRNALNLGFVGATNRGMDAATAGDVLLLNADTVVPERFVERLQAAAYREPDIGTVIPFSNNGEFVSLPRPFIANPFVNPDAPEMEVAVLDLAASRANGDELIDLPSGIGFCLYITGRCLADLPRLTEGWGRGYLEDVDYCLRAARHGWRNVCATGIFVGHHGTLSFREEKRALVVGNMRRLSARFPGYRAACASFVSADPLAASRARIERYLSRATPVDRLIVAGPLLAGLAEEEARRAGAQGQACLLLNAEPDGRHVRLRDCAGGLPQNLRFDLGEPDFAAYLHELRIVRCELFGLEPLPVRLVAALRDWPAGLFVASTRAATRGARAGEIDVTALLQASRSEAVEAADELVAAQLAALGRADVPHRQPFRPSEIAHAARPLGSALLVVMPEPDAAAFALVRAIVGDLGGRDNSRRVVVLGRTPDDRALMSREQVQVTGPVPAEELGDAARVYGAGSVLLPDRFGSARPEAIAAARLSLPIAYIGPQGHGNGLDLVLDPEMDAQTMARHVTEWTVRLGSPMNDAA